jgi:hypothetical protein
MTTKAFIKMKKTLFVALFAVLTFTAGYAQSKNFWSAVPHERAVQLGEIKESFDGITDNLFQIDMESLRTALSGAGKRGSGVQGIMIAIPNADGKIEHYRVFEESNFAPELQAEFPGIRAYVGYGVEDPTAYLRMSVSHLNVQTMVLRADKGSEFIEPYTANNTVYSVFSSAMKREKGKLPFTCYQQDEIINIDATDAMMQRSDVTVFKTFSLALSCTGEYTSYHGGTVANALAAMNATMTRVNGVYEKDLAVKLEIIANNTAIIYTSSASDPYSGPNQGAGGAWSPELQSNLNTVIGSANYDIGHLFGASGGGGFAGCIGCVCNSADKGSGYTSPGQGGPEGDSFDIDYVAHEMGHQLGANHTYSVDYEGTGVNVEPGSGSTIMGYAGITGPGTDIQQHSDDYFTYVSIDQIQDNLASKSCATNAPISNVAMTINAGTDYSIPKSTPFILKAVNADGNAAGVTYTWEQNDDATNSFTGGNSVVYASKLGGPTFRSLPPVASPNRYMPAFSTVLNNSVTSTWETASSVSRTLNFTLTGRDNEEGAGKTKTDAMRVFVKTVGPFNVTSQNTNGIVWMQGSQQTITWNVAGTTGNNINTANVRILLSTNNGTTFNTVLSESTPNDGSETITVPMVTPSVNCRIMIEPVGNIYYAINTNKFAIALLGSEEFSLANFSIYPNPNTGNFTVEFNSESGQDVNILVHDMRGRQIFSSNYKNTGIFSENVNLSNVEAGVYLVTVNDGARKEMKRIVVN